MPRASVVVVLLLLQAAPAAAQSYDSSFRFGLGLDYAGLAGRGDGSLGGLRLQMGARVHEHVAVYWQGQILGGAFVEPERVTGAALGWNAVLVEANVGIFQVGAGPSFDATVLCDIDTSDNGGLTGCSDRFGPGLAARAGIRFGIFTFSGDLHVTFDDTRDPMVWVLAGIGVQLGDVANEPMRFATGEPEAPEPALEVSEPPPLEAAPPRVTTRPAATTLGRMLDDPYGDGGWMPEPDEAEAPERWQPRRAPASEPERASAPVVRRFTRGDVDREAARAAATPSEDEPAAAPRARGPAFDGALEFEETDDPIGGLDER